MVGGRSGLSVLVPSTCPWVGSERPTPACLKLWTLPQGARPWAVCKGRLVAAPSLPGPLGRKLGSGWRWGLCQAPRCLQLSWKGKSCCSSGSPHQARASLRSQHASLWHVIPHPTGSQAGGTGFSHPRFRAECDSGPPLPSMPNGSGRGTGAVPARAGRLDGKPCLFVNVTLLWLSH